jgi:hypothetical protein
VGWGKAILAFAPWSAAGNAKGSLGRRPPLPAAGHAIRRRVELRFGKAILAFAPWSAAGNAKGSLGRRPPLPAAGHA